MGNIYSMTGFGVANYEQQGLFLSIEVKAVNNRGLKINVRSKTNLGLCEQIIRNSITEKLVRGSVDVFITLHRTIDWEKNKLKAESAKNIIQTIKKLAKEIDIKDDLSASHLLNIPGIFDNPAEETLTENECELISKVLNEVLAQVLEMRVNEGKNLQNVLKSAIQPVKIFVEETKKIAPQVVEKIKERLQNKLLELNPQGIQPLDQQALEREVCFFADRADITEELDRLDSHIKQYESILKNGGEAGKKLEFLAQELLREINTTAAKANNTNIINNAIEAKLAVEKIKEQSANIV